MKQLLHEPGVWIALFIIVTIVVYKFTVHNARKHSKNMITDEQQQFINDYYKSNPHLKP